MRRRDLWACCLLLPAVLPGGFSTAALAQTLRIGIGGTPTSVDPHFFNASPNASLAMHLFDSLTVRNATAQLRPGLALSWRAVSGTEWELTLRPGVRWHDGQAFTADDVAFSLARAANVAGSPAGFANFVRAIQRVEIPDPLTLRLHTAEPRPLLPTDLASVFIVSRHAGDGAATADYNSGKAAVGTGPYRFVSHAPGSRTVLARNDAYWGARQPWDTVELRVVANPAARTAAVLSGDLDVVDQVGAADLPRLRADPRVTLAEIQGLRVIYLSPDRSRTADPVFVTGNDGRPLAQNPFNDGRVRRALSLAINRDALATRTLEGAATPAGQWLPPGTFGYNDQVPPPQQDTDAARRLLAEAGFPQGFRLTLHSPNDRFPNDAQLAQAVAQMWARVGVGTVVETLPWTAFVPRASKQEFGMFLLGWNSSSGEASLALNNVLSTANPSARTGQANFARYGNPALDTLTARAIATGDDDRRRELLQQAVALAMDDVALIPLVQLKNSWAARRGFSVEPRMDERTLAAGIRPEPR